LITRIVFDEYRSLSYCGRYSSEPSVILEASK
jgi:hypothetical protein